MSTGIWEVKSEIIWKSYIVLESSNLLHVMCTVMVSQPGWIISATNTFRHRQSIESLSHSDSFCRPHIPATLGFAGQETEILEAYTRQKVTWSHLSAVQKSASSWKNFLRFLSSVIQTPTFEYRSLLIFNCVNTGHCYYLTVWIQVTATI